MPLRTELSFEKNNYVYLNIFNLSFGIGGSIFYNYFLSTNIKIIMNAKNTIPISAEQDY